MKYLKYVVLAFLLWLPIYVNALEMTPGLSCDKSMISNEESTNCAIRLDVSSGGIKSFEADLESSSNLEISNIVVSDIWNNNTIGTHISTSVSDISESSGILSTFVVTAKNATLGTIESINLNNIRVTDELGASVTYDNLSTSIKIPSDNAKLNTLIISEGTLSPSFDPDVKSYTAIVESDRIEISATGAANASISGTGVKNLSYGDTTFQIIVKAESGKVETYSITVTRKNNKSNDSSLKSLEVVGATFQFTPEKKEYRDVVISSDTETFTVNAVANHTKAKVEYSINNNQKIGLDEIDTITVIVTAEDGSTSTYRVTAIRKDNRSSNNNLKSLTMNGKSVSLNNTSQSYTLTVDNSVTTANVVALVEDSKATVKVTGANTLKVGNNVFTITVTAENTDIKTYTLIVIRKNSDGDITNLSNNSDLKSLEVKDVDIDFEKKKLEYSFEVENDVEQLKISYVLDDSKASVTVDGNKDLKVGLNTIKIIVTAENGESSTYVLKVTRKDKNYEVENNTNSIIKALQNKEKYEQVVVKVDSSSNLLIPNNIIKALINSKKTITYKVIENDIMKYSIALNGSLFNEYDKDINYGLTFQSNNSSLIEKIGTRKNVILNFEHNDVVPTGTLVTIFVGDKYTDGSSLYLYQYNLEKEDLELIDENLAVENGYVTISFNSLSEVVLLNSNLVNDDVIDPDKVDSEEYKTLLLYGVGGGLLLVLVIILIILIKKKKGKSNKKIKKIEGSNEQSVSEEIAIPEISTINTSDDIDLIEIIDEPVNNSNEFLLGISAMDIDDYLEKCPLADLKNSNIKEGIVIVGFENNSPIERSGLHQGDVLLEINKQKIINKEHFKNLVSQVNRGMEVSFTYYRNGENKEFNVLL